MCRILAPDARWGGVAPPVLDNRENLLERRCRTWNDEPIGYR